MRRISSLFRSKNTESRSLTIPDALDTTTSPSSASSSGSASVRTPDDDAAPRPISKKSWIPAWLTPKRSAILKRSSDDENHIHVQHFLVQPVPVPSLRHQLDDHDDDSSDDDDDQDDDDSDAPLHITNTLLSPSALQISRNHLEILILNSLSIPPCSSPLYHIPGTHQFPRSCHIARLLPPSDSLRISLLRSQLLNTLHNTPSLSPPDARLLSPLASRPPPKLLQRPPPTTEDVVVDRSRISSVSSGVSRWIARPCFEDRFALWLPSPDSPYPTPRPVQGSAFAVAELEFSEVIETLAGLDLTQSRPHQDEFNPLSLPIMPEELSDQTSSTSASSSSSSLSVPSPQRNTPYKATPSPLREQHGPSNSQPSSVSPTPDSQTQISTASPPHQPETQPTPAKRGVRFAEDGKEDQIPLAYVLRIKKQREEKALFLRQERERRAFEEERRKQEKERLERERERREWERERKAWELEKKALEEERKARLYAEEIAAARRRRESARAGTLIPASQPSPRELEDHRRRDSRGYLRPPYDVQQRRQASDSTLDRPTTSRSQSGGASPSGSGSRPPSVYSAHTISSSEDGRLRDVAAAANGSIRSKKRGSVGSISSQRTPSEHRSPSYTSIQNAIPPVPPIPQPYAMDVPLLPPTPPFMMQQFSRPRSANSASPVSSRQRLPRSGSADAMDSPIPRQDNVSVSPKRETGSHRRRASGENFTASTSDRGRPSKNSNSQPNSYSRGTAVQLGMVLPMTPGPGYFQQNPWTALPTIAQLQQQGPMMMSFNGRPPPPGRPAILS